MRAQFVNSSPANGRSVFDRDQLGTGPAAQAIQSARDFASALRFITVPICIASTGSSFPVKRSRGTSPARVSASMSNGAPVRGTFGASGSGSVWTIARSPCSTSVSATPKCVASYTLDGMSPDAAASNVELIDKFSN